MINNSMQILRKSNYFINCDINDNLIKLNVSWDKNVIAIKWNENLEAITSNYSDSIIKCPKYASSIIAEMLIDAVTISYNYPEAK